MEFKVGDIVTVTDKIYHHHKKKGRLIKKDSTVVSVMPCHVKWLELHEDYPMEGFYMPQQLKFLCRPGAEQCKTCKDKLRCITR